MKPRRCDSYLFDEPRKPEWRCHRDYGHPGDHIHYSETSDRGCSAWANWGERVLWQAPGSEVDVDWTEA